MDDLQNNFNDEADDRVDRATSERLAKLRSMPVDVSRLERRLQAAIEREMAPQQRWWRAWLRPYRLAAAAVLVAAIIAGLLLTGSSGPALASANEMAQMHEDLVSGRTPIMQVDSIADASRMLSKEWPQSPNLPNAPETHVMACCMKCVKDKRMACVLLKSEGVPVTMAVARSADMRLPASPTQFRRGITYHVQSSGRLNMVMTERNGRWVCLIGELPVDRLMDFADQLQI